MNREIIYLEPDEEITSIIDKLTSLDDVKEVLLVAPKNASISQSIVNLKILKKEAEKLKLHVGIVTSEMVARNLSAQVGLPIYDSINSAKPSINPTQSTPNLDETIQIDMSEKKPATPPPGVKIHHYEGVDAPSEDQPAKITKEKNTPNTHSTMSPMSASKFVAPSITKTKKPKKWLKRSLIVLSILVIGFAIIYYFYPKATLKAQITTESIEEDIQIEVDTSIGSVSEDGNIIPGEVVSSDQEKEDTFQASGKKNIGEKATGTVTISNGAGTNIELASGSQITSNGGLKFVTTQSITIPAATATVDTSGSVSKISGNANVSVEASDSGSEYNIGPSDFTVANYANLTGSSSDNFSGGSNQEITIVSSEDIEKAQTQLEDAIKQTIKENLVNSAAEKELTLIADTLEYEVSSFTTSVESGTETDSFTAKIKLIGRTIAFTQKDYQDAVIKALGNKIPEDKELILSSEDEIVQGDVDIDYSKGTMSIDGKIKTKLAPIIDLNNYPSELTGKNIVEAENILKQNNNILEVEVNTNVSWFSRLPLRSSAIKVEKIYSSR